MRLGAKGLPSAAEPVITVILQRGSAQKNGWPSSTATESEMTVFLPPNEKNALKTDVQTFETAERCGWRGYSYDVFSVSYCKYSYSRLSN